MSDASGGVDLWTAYLGLRLRSPLGASASPLTGTLDGLRRLEQAGAGAVVPPSLFEEQVTHELLETDAELEARDLDVIQAVRAAVGARVTVKVGPFFTAMANMAARMIAVGAGAWFGDDAASPLAREQVGEDVLPGANVPQVRERDRSKTSPRAAGWSAGPNGTGVPGRQSLSAATALPLGSTRWYGACQEAPSGR